MPWASGQEELQDQSQIARCLEWMKKEENVGAMGATWVLN
jgi:hypothetical protein